MSALLVSHVVLWLVVIFQTLLLIGVVNTLGEGSSTASATADADPDAGLLRLRGRTAPEFTASLLSGKRLHSTAALGVGDATSLLFVDVNCATCGITLTQYRALVSKTAGEVYVVCKGTAAECKDKAGTYELPADRVLVDESGEIAEKYGVQVTPTAVIVDGVGVVATYGHPLGAAEYDQLFAKHNGGVGVHDHAA